MSFDKSRHSCNYHTNQDINTFRHPERCLVPTRPVPRPQADSAFSGAHPWSAALPCTDDLRHSFGPQPPAPRVRSPPFCLPFQVHVTSVPPRGCSETFVFFWMELDFGSRHRKASAPTCLHSVPTPNTSIRLCEGVCFYFSISFFLHFICGTIRSGHSLQPVCAGDRLDSSL